MFLRGLWDVSLNGDLIEISQRHLMPAGIISGFFYIKGIVQWYRSLIFTLGNIRLWFPISGHLFIYRPKYCWVPQSNCSTFPQFFIIFCKLLLSALFIFSVEAVWISFLALTWMFDSLRYFNHRTVLRFWTAGRLLFGRFINYKIKIYTRWLTWKTLNGFITNRCIKF